MTPVEIAQSTAPWIATVFGVGAAVAAEQAFRYGNEGTPPDRWRGSDVFMSDWNHAHESDERLARDRAREIAAASQVASTYLASGAAIEAAAASQHGNVALTLAALGIICIGPIAKRAVRAIDEIQWVQAWYLRLKWDMRRKMVRSQNFEEEDALFAREHPKAARILARHKIERTPSYDAET